MISYHHRDDVLFSRLVGFLFSPLQNHSNIVGGFRCSCGSYITDGRSGGEQLGEAGESFGGDSSVASDLLLSRLLNLGENAG